MGLNHETHCWVTVKHETTSGRFQETTFTAITLNHAHRIHTRRAHNEHNSMFTSTDGHICAWIKLQRASLSAHKGNHLPVHPCRHPVGLCRTWSLTAHHNTKHHLDSTSASRHPCFMRSVCLDSLRPPSLSSSFSFSCSSSSSSMWVGSRRSTQCASANEELGTLAENNPLTGYEPNFIDNYQISETTEIFIQESSSDSSPSNLHGSEISDDTIGRVLTSPLFTQEREEPEP